MEGEPKPKLWISFLTMAVLLVGADLQSINLFLVVIPIKVSHLSNSAGKYTTFQLLALVHALQE